MFWSNTNSGGEGGEGKNSRGTTESVTKTADLVEEASPLISESSKREKDFNENVDNYVIGKKIQEMFWEKLTN